MTRDASAPLASGVSSSGGHTIHRLAIDVTASSGDVTDFDLARLRGIGGGALANVLDRCFTQADHMTIGIDRIEIDLGTIDEADLPRSFVEPFVRALTEAIAARTLGGDPAPGSTEQVMEAPRRAGQYRPLDGVPVAFSADRPIGSVFEREASDHTRLDRFVALLRADLTDPRHQTIEDASASQPCAPKPGTPRPRAPVMDDSRRRIDRANTNPATDVPAATKSQGSRDTIAQGDPVRLETHDRSSRPNAASGSDERTDPSESGLVRPRPFLDRDEHAEREVNPVRLILGRTLSTLFESDRPGSFRQNDTADGGGSSGIAWTERFDPLRGFPSRRQESRVEPGDPTRGPTAQTESSPRSVANLRPVQATRYDRTEFEAIDATNEADAPGALTPRSRRPLGTVQDHAGSDRALLSASAQDIEMIGLIDMLEKAGSIGRHDLVASILIDAVPAARLRRIVLRLVDPRLRRSLVFLNEARVDPDDEAMVLRAMIRLVLTRRQPFRVLLARARSIATTVARLDEDRSNLEDDRLRAIQVDGTSRPTLGSPDDWRSAIPEDVAPRQPSRSAHDTRLPQGILVADHTTGLAAGDARHCARTVSRNDPEFPRGRRPAARERGLARNERRIARNMPIVVRALLATVPAKMAEDVIARLLPRRASLLRRLLRAGARTPNTAAATWRAMLDPIAIGSTALSRTALVAAIVDHATTASERGGYLSTLREADERLATIVDRAERIQRRELERDARAFGKRPPRRRGAVGPDIAAVGAFDVLRDVAARLPSEVLDALIGTIHPGTATAFRNATRARDPIPTFDETMRQAALVVATLHAGRRAAKRTVRASLAAYAAAIADRHAPMPSRTSMIDAPDRKDADIGAAARSRASHAGTTARTVRRRSADRARDIDRPLDSLIRLGRSRPSAVRRALRAFRPRAPLIAALLAARGSARREIVTALAGRRARGIAALVEGADDALADMVFSATLSLLLSRRRPPVSPIAILDATAKRLAVVPQEALAALRQADDKQILAPLARALDRRDRRATRHARERRAERTMSAPPVRSESGTMIGDPPDLVDRLAGRHAPVFRSLFLALDADETLSTAFRQATLAILLRRNVGRRPLRRSLEDIRQAALRRLERSDPIADIDATSKALVDSVVAASRPPARAFAAPAGIPLGSSAQPAHAATPPGSYGPNDEVDRVSPDGRDVEAGGAGRSTSSGSRRQAIATVEAPSSPPPTARELAPRGQRIFDDSVVSRIDTAEVGAADRADAGRGMRARHAMHGLASHLALHATIPSWSANPTAMTAAELLSRLITMHPRVVVSAFAEAPAETLHRAIEGLAVAETRRLLATLLKPRRAAPVLRIIGIVDATVRRSDASLRPSGVAIVLLLTSSRPSSPERFVGEFLRRVAGRGEGRLESLVEDLSRRLSSSSGAARLLKLTMDAARPSIGARGEPRRSRGGARVQHASSSAAIEALVITFVELADRPRRRHDPPSSALAAPGERFAGSRPPGAALAHFLWFGSVPFGSFLDPAIETAIRAGIAGLEETKFGEPGFLGLAARARLVGDRRSSGSEAAARETDPPRPSARGPRSRETVARDVDGIIEASCVASERAFTAQVARLRDRLARALSDPVTGPATLDRLGFGLPVAHDRLARLFSDRGFRSRSARLVERDARLGHARDLVAALLATGATPWWYPSLEPPREILERLVETRPRAVAAALIGRVSAKDDARRMVELTGAGTVGPIVRVLARRHADAIGRLLDAAWPLVETEADRWAIMLETLIEWHGSPRPDVVIEAFVRKAVVRFALPRASIAEALASEHTNEAAMVLRQLRRITDTSGLVGAPLTVDPRDDAVARARVVLRYGGDPGEIATAIDAAISFDAARARDLLRAALSLDAPRGRIARLPKSVLVPVLRSLCERDPRSFRLLLEGLSSHPACLDPVLVAIGAGRATLSNLLRIVEAERRRRRAQTVANQMKPGDGQGATDAERTDRIGVANAGLVILAPYFGRLFDTLGFLDEDRMPRPDLAGRAARVLQYLVTEATDADDFDLALNKLLCGLDPRAEPPLSIVMTDEERSSADGLLLGVTQNWPPLRTTSIAGLRETFLRRDATLTETPEAWILKVVPGPFDMLLDRLPWPISIVRLRWMKKLLRVEWR